jgi:DNA processing protein
MAHQPSPQPSMSEAEKRNRLRLARTQNVGPITFRELITRFGSAGAALDALPALAAKGGRSRALRICPESSVEQEWNAADKIEGRLIFWGEADYPDPLAALEDAPPFLCVLGHPHLLQSQAIAVVGSRNASVNGKRFARDISSQLNEAGLTIVSGMARGIDTAAHEGALQGATIAVLAGGADIIYPKENTALYGQIRERGLIVSEMSSGTTPQARHFPRRNRIISGLSLGVVVVEAALRSGSLISARCALEQGREVFAGPGSPLDPRCRGTNNLIRNGAVLTESLDDILQELDAMRSRQINDGDDDDLFTPRPLGKIDDSDLGKARVLITQALGPSPIAIDDLIRETGLSVALVHVVLLEFDLAGQLERHSGQRVSLIFQ